MNYYVYFLYCCSSLAFLVSLRPARLMMFLIQLVVAALNTGHHRKLYDFLKQRGKKQHGSQDFETNLLRVINNFGEVLFQYRSHLVLKTWLAGNILAHLLFMGYSRFHQSEKIFLINTLLMSSLVSLLQSGALSLVEIRPDTELWLVEPYYAGT